MKVLAKFFSWLFLPLLMPLYGIVAAMYIQSIPLDFDAQKSLFFMRDEIKSSILYIFIIFTAIAPALSLLMLKLNKVVSSLEINDRKERTSPIFITAIYAAIMYGFFLYQGNIGLPIVLLGTSLGGVIGILICLLINYKTKISLHAFGTGTLFGFLISYYQMQEAFNFNILYYALAIGVITAISRLILQKHSLSQLGLGYLVGFLSQIITITLYLKFS